MFSTVVKAEHGNSNSSFTAASDQGTTYSATADENHTAAPSDSCEVEAVHQMPAEDTPSIPSAAAVTDDVLSATNTTLLSAGSVKRKRGRPPLHSKQSTERRHEKLLDVTNSTVIHFAVMY